MKNVKVYTNSSFNETIEIVSYLQPVTYHIVLGVNFFADFLSSFSDFFGGKSQSYQSRLSAINHEVIEGIKQKVYSIGGNAAIDLKIDNDEISAQGKSMIMVTAIATAVIIKEKSFSEIRVNNEIPKNGLKAVTFDDFSNFQKKRWILKTLEVSKHCGPISSLLTEIKSENFDVLPFVFVSINNGEFNPKDHLTRESLNTLSDMVNSLDYESRVDILYGNLKYIIDEGNNVIFRNNKLSFYIELIEEYNSIDYRFLNEILLMSSGNTLEKNINHYVRGIEKKSIFFPEDIIHLQKGMEILVSLGIKKEDYHEKFLHTIDSLERMFE
jgi:uncharacterized protein YbjQ (UPF0145 family)